MSISQNSQNLEKINWEWLKYNVFDVDGSLRDIYMENMNQMKWFKLINYFLHKQKISFVNFYSEKEGKNYYEFPENWQEILEEVTTFSFGVEYLNISITFHCFSRDQVEATIDPSKFKEIGDFINLHKVLNEIKGFLELEKWYITPENQEDFIIITSENF